MKKNIALLALALVLVGSLASCSNRDPNGTSASGNNGSVTSGANGSNGGAGTGTTGGGTGSTGSTSGTAGTVSRRYGGASTANGSDYFEDGRYTAGSSGRVYDRDNSAASRDLTRDARDIVRDAGNAIGDVSRGIGDVITGSDSFNGTPSWQGDSSAMRY